MNADPQLRERLDRAAGRLHIDTERRLDELHRAAPRRGRTRRVAAFAVAAALMAVAGTAAWQLNLFGDPARPGVGTGPTGRIAFMSLSKPLSERDSSDLYVLDAASGEVTPLHEGGGFSIAPQWSPDGSRLAFASNETASGEIGIFVAEADGTGAVNILASDRMLEDGGPISLAWSPDGSQIAYTGRDPETGRPGAWIIGDDGRGRRTVPEIGPGYWESVAWSPGGGSIALTGDLLTEPDSDQIDLYVVSLVERPPGARGPGPLYRRVTNDPLIERWPAWSPDGSRIAFARTSEDDFENTDYGQDVWIMDADGSNERKLTDWEGLDGFPAWSPDGAWIAFASDRGATAEQQEGNRGVEPFSGVSVYAMRPDGSDVRLLADGGEIAFLPSAWTS